MLIANGDCRNDGGETGEITASVTTFQTPVSEMSQLLECFQATEPRVVLVVVDNSPTDQLRSLVENSGVAEYRWLGRNIGFGAAHNIAMKQLLHRGRYHLVVNPDIRFGPNVVAELTQLMDLHPEVGQAMPRIEFSDGSEQRLCKLLPTPFDLLLRRFVASNLFQEQRDRYELRDIDMGVARQVPNLSGCFMFLRSSVVRRTGGFDERYFMYMEDVDLCRRISQVAQTAFFPQVSVVHGYAKGSYRDPKLLVYHLKSSFQYFCKWGWVLDQERKRLNQKARTEASVITDTARMSETFCKAEASHMHGEDRGTSTSAGGVE